MESIPFSKYHGAGNDFIMIDDREGRWGPHLTQAWVAQACHRRFGVGADGLILVQQSPEGGDFFMKYYNSDGRTSSFCGNGGRCIVAYAASLGVHPGRCDFLGTDGWHHGELTSDGQVCISMTDVLSVNRLGPESMTLFTGSPHYIAFVPHVESMDVFTEGRSIRYSDMFTAEGINVNFVEYQHAGEIRVRTYERGVEDETFACGTGVVAAAIAACVQHDHTVTSWHIHAKGGDLRVDFIKKSAEHFTQVKLTGPAVEVFRGTLELD